MQPHDIFTNFTHKQEVELGMLKLKKDDDNWIEKRWPTRIFYGEKGQLMHPYTRSQTPNLKLMNCYYRCKSYRTFGCDARLKLQEIPNQPGKDDWVLVGEHSEMCKRRNGIKPANYTSPGKTCTKAHLKDVTEDFKNRLVELALEKIWLAPMKIWCMVRDETVGSGNEVALTFPNSEVVSIFIY